MAITAGYILRVARATTGTYLMGGNGPNEWDCSGFVSHCVGAPAGTRYFATPGEGQWLASHGFRDVKDSVNFSTGAGMKKGDILVWNRPGTSGEGADGHTEIYYGNGTTIGARGPTGNQVGIPGGFASLTSVPWQECWRPAGDVAIISWTGD